MYRPVKALWIERLNGVPTSLTGIPQKYHEHIIRFAKVYYYSDEDCDILCQQLELFGFRIWIHRIFAKKDIYLSPRTPRHIYVAHIMLGDSVTAVLQPDGTPFELREEEGNLFSLLAEAQLAPVNAGQQFISFHVNVFPEDLPGIVRRYPALRPLLDRPVPEQSGPLNFEPFRLNAVCEFLRREVEKCKYIEIQAKYFLTKVGADLFSNFLQQDISAADAVIVPDLSVEKVIRKCFRIILEEFHLPLSIRKLAFRLGLPRITLQEAFKSAYGITVPDFLHMVRMIRAFQLMAESDFYSERIAVETGFSDVQVFYKAFRDYYGIGFLELRNAQ
ncbi:helix-turn-helix transcriptional regulator [Chitinophaga sp. XS-30]|uniref:helix-turn-helix transcriptional regulator n=1 Tax=Chitinophaga sp. XS-30 TaxID=2604421 RepID=UPI0011DE4BA4|nr:AraC family transcriptional regulator [Chitinophaga sp. XS-30]QEH43032.1 helix-turn-helix transcriptional regulator [Chitinophaga sp. XS-30]